MIPVRRPQQEPKVLQKNGTKWLHKLEQAINNLQVVKSKSNPIATPQEITKAEKDIENATKKYKDSEIKKALEQMFHGKCAYCESQVLTTGYGDIEHFYPKSQYIKLTFVWSNLLLSCERCNDAGHKGTQFPLDTNGNPLLINPTDEKTDINQHLRFSWDIVDCAKVEGIDAHGQIVENIFDLNSEHGTRKELLKHRTEHVNQILTLLQIAQKTGNSEAIQLLLEHCQPSSEYSAFALIYVLPHLVHHFRSPDAIALFQQVCQRSPAYAGLTHFNLMP